MVTNLQQPFFILGLPRSRTAWLSIIATLCGAPCTHEGRRGHATFAGYAAALDTAVHGGAAGDADPSLIFHTAELLARWPEARFVVIERPADSALAAMIAASPPESAAVLRAGWTATLQAFAVTCDLLRENRNARFIPYEALMDAGVIRGLVAHLGGAMPAADQVDRWQRLHITTEIVEPGRLIAPPPPRPAAPPHAAVLARSVCDVEGLAACLYVREEFATVAAWWRQHTGLTLCEAALPPLGVLVSLRGLPVAALWCYECYGVPVAELAFPVTKPGLTLRDARRALIYAVAVAIQAAGKGHEPEAAFTTFKVLAPPGLARYLARLGFQPALTERQPMMLTLT